MNKIKYLVVGGYLFSHKDSDRHYVSAKKLMELYHVNPQECISSDAELYEKSDLRGYSPDLLTGLIPLRPRADGNYDLPK